MSPSSLSGMGGQGRGPPPVYLLNCSVCKGEFYSREKWLEHLTLGDHQSLAREGLQDDLNDLRDSSLMIFTSYDLTVDGSLKIIQYFGKDPAVWVTDFLWWEERPRFAIVQFESRKKTEEILIKVEAFAADTIQIDNQGFQMKGAFDLLDLEWKAILPGSITAPLIPLKSFHKSAKESEASISAENDNHQRLSNCIPDETEEKTEENCSAGEGKEEDCTNYVKLLIALAKERQWEPPNFRTERVNRPGKKNTFICTVLLNGEVYKPDGFTCQSNTFMNAKKLAAKFCLEALKPETISVRNTKYDHRHEENLNTEASSNPISASTTTTSNPVATLIALSRNLYGISPRFKISHVSKRRRYYCSVSLNEKNYSPPVSKGSGESAEAAKLKAAQFCLETIQQDDGIIAEEYLSAQQSHLIHQFTVISEFVEIPDEKCEQVLGIQKSFRDVLQKVEPSAQVIIFRNWYLKLRNSALENEPVFLYIYARRGIPEGNGAPTPTQHSEDNFNWIPGKLVQMAISELRELFIRIDKIFPHPDDPQETRLGCKFLHKPSGVRFIVANFRRTMAEAQCCQLVKYFCEFDPRIRPLLIVARYWLITNGIHWGEPQGTARNAHQCLPEPHPLDWMILTFLMEGKYVPSLRTILARPHKVIFEKATLTDIGFSADIPFAREWKREKNIKTESGDHFILATLQMFQNFLEFCSTKIFDQGGVIINPKDGEILETSRFLSGDFTSELTTEEMAVLKQFQENSDNDNSAKYCVNFRKWNWYMIHPLVINWRFSVPARNQELPLINTAKKTNERLKQLLKLVENEGAEKAFEICESSLCEILKMDKEIPSLDPVPSRPSRKRPMESVENEPGNEDDVPSNKKKTKIRKASQPGPTIVTFDHAKSTPPPEGDETSLANQLYTLLEESVVIPDNQFEKVLQAVNFLKKAFFHSNDPTCKVSLFRSWNLKLKQLQNDPEDMPLVYVYNRKPCEETDSDFSVLPSGKIWSILKSGEVKKKINVLEGPTPKGKDPSAFKKGWTLECKRFGEDGDEEKFQLCLFSSHKFIFEVEVDGLLEYMCKFDDRAYHLIKLAYLWMGLNKLTFGTGTGEHNGLSVLQWLVIFWMCHKKMVPSPSEIQGRRNHKVMRDGGTGVDLGWEEDYQFLEEWRDGRKVGEVTWSDDYVVRLLYTFSEFLEFCWWLGEGSAGNWILNTRHGVLIDIQTFLNLQSGDNYNWAETMSEEELTMLRSQIINFQDQKIYMTHPLNMQWRFGQRNDIEHALKSMCLGGNRLKKYLNVRKSCGEKEANKLFDNLRNLFTL